MKNISPTTSERAPEAAPIAIRARGVSKKYYLQRHKTFLTKEVFGWLRGNVVREAFWALKDVSFEIHRGESVGIVGENGAGKSTLLSIIAGTTYPTEGDVEVHGRVTALLELGAGFHPDMTGRENIVINASLMGLSRAEIERKLPEIIAFTELETFIDTPVRNYSSGMLARLGFSVAAHLDPDILIIDEVLSVGDAHFQQKSLKRIEEFRAQGKTLVFVSHSIDQVREICDRAFELRHGQLRMVGSAASVTQHYLRDLEAESHPAPPAPPPPERGTLRSRVGLIALLGALIAPFAYLALHLGQPPSAATAATNVDWRRAGGVAVPSPHGVVGFRLDGEPSATAAAHLSVTAGLEHRLALEIEDTHADATLPRHVEQRLFVDGRLKWVHDLGAGDYAGWQRVEVRFTPSSSESEVRVDLVETLPGIDREASVTRLRALTITGPSKGPLGRRSLR